MQKNRKLRGDQAEEFIGFPRQMIHRAYKAGRLRGYAAGPYGPVYYAESDLTEWAESLASTPTPRTNRRRARAGVSR